MFVRHSLQHGTRRECRKSQNVDSGKMCAISLISKKGVRTGGLIKASGYIKFTSLPELPFLFIIFFLLKTASSGFLYVRDD